MFFIQREENRTLIPSIKSIYTDFLNCIYPISICDNKLYEIENRLRFIEEKITNEKKIIYIDILKYMRYKLLSKICFGNTRKKYKQKYDNIKNLIS